MKITLKHIAAECGYSISTVSRVLSGSSSISVEVQRKVIACAERLGYPFNRSTIPFNSNGALHITLITDFHTHEFYSSYFVGYADTADQMGLHLSLVNCVNWLDRLDELIIDQYRRRTDGIVLFIPSMERSDYITLMKNLRNAKCHIPIVSNGLIQSPVLPTVTFDGYSGGFLAGYHFAQRGYKTVGILKGPAGKAESSFRSNGFKDACEQKQLQITWEATGDFGFETAYAAFSDLMASEIRPSAVFASSDLMAIGLFEAAREHGLKVPDDIALLGYDDLPMCRQIHPELSSIHTDFNNLAKLTLQNLVDLISKRQLENQTLSFIPVRLEARGSS
jgi:DNA-binding LacI/PurR family transcriptional regulator